MFSTGKIRRKMGKYFAKRLGMAILTIFLVACLTFLLMNAVPGSPWLSEKHLLRPHWLR